jgi:hypothetical protein
MTDEVRALSPTEIADKRRFVAMRGLLLASERDRQRYDARWLCTLDERDREIKRLTPQQEPLP